MGLDVDRFLNADFHAREERVPVPDLAGLFPAGEEPVWVVRGLTGLELGRVLEAGDRQRNLAALVGAVAAGSPQEKGEALRRLVGLSDEDSPDNYVKGIELLMAGSVDPPCSRELAVRFADAFATEFWLLVGRINVLTGQGKTLGKPSGSGQTPESEPPSPCATTGDDSSSK